MLTSTRAHEYLGTGHHPHDIPPAALESMERMTRHPQMLREVVAASRDTLGFFPAHNPRALEYPWIMAQLPKNVRGVRILDVGAGVNVLPFMLAQRGAAVITLDNHSTTRDPEHRHDWNEWGFLDYSLLDPRVISVRAPYEKWHDMSTFDCIYSVSVIEHLPRATQAVWIAGFKRQLKAGGLLLLTVDLVRDTNQLWNLCEGKAVEDPAIHGEFVTLLDELCDAGFEVESTEIQRNIPDCRVDVGFISARASNNGIRV
jgi:2-polyprenyl-3-methyl-5-hydroxy-6-metoxy-1,4-benzoquinol methylase